MNFLVQTFFRYRDTGQKDYYKYVQNKSTEERKRHAMDSMENHHKKGKIDDRERTIVSIIVKAYVNFALWKVYIYI